MAARPYVLVNCAVSLDGYLDDAGPNRLILSNSADLERVDAVRAGCDAILVGANTIRRDNPRLLVRSATRQPIRVTLTASGRLDPTAAFFGPGVCVVYAASRAVPELRRAVAADVVDIGDPPAIGAALSDLHARGVGRLLVEGGGSVLTGFLSGGHVDEMRIVVAPFLVGDSRAPRFLRDGTFPHHPGVPMTLAETRQMGDLLLLRYLLNTDHRWMVTAIDLARKCTPSPSAFSVGAIVVDDHGHVLGQGHSRERDRLDHAEEVALDRSGPSAAGATLYSSLEPCGRRRSRPVSCARLIVDSGIRRVVFAWREPPVFGVGGGAEILRSAGVTVAELAELADKARAVNAHLLG